MSTLLKWMKRVGKKLILWIFSLVYVSSVNGWVPRRMQCPLNDFGFMVNLTYGGLRRMNLRLSKIK